MTADSTDVRVRTILLDGALEAYGSGDGPRPEGIRYHRTHCHCGRPVAADRACPVHGAPKEDS